MDARRREFVLGIITGKLPPIKETQELKDSVWKILMRLNTYLSKDTQISFLAGKYVYSCTLEEQEKAKKESENLTVLQSMLVHMTKTMESPGNIYDYNMRFQKSVGEKLMDAYAILEMYGWTFENENEVKLLNGTHEYYEKEDK